MIHANKLYWNHWGDPQLTIVVTGSDDVYRIADHLTRGQCEFADIGFRVQRGLRRKWGSRAYRRMLRIMHGDGGFR